MIKALVLGELCEDILLHNPAGVEVMGQKTWAKDIVLSAGGSTYYTGAALLHLGADVKISSVLGTDEAGDRVYNQMMLDGLNICHTERLPGRKTTKSMMVCDGGDKQFIGCTPMLPLKIPEWLALKGSDLFYIAGYTLYPELWEEEMVNLCCKAKRHGVCIAMDSQLLPIVGDNLAQISNCNCFDYIITSNGCDLRDLKKNVTIDCKTLSQETVEQVIALLKQYRVYFECFIQGQAVTEKNLMAVRLEASIIADTAPWATLKQGHHQLSA